ncbi:hypothetical protein ACIOHA_15865 [Streptomyces anulatus]
MLAGFLVGKKRNPLDARLQRSALQANVLKECESRCPFFGGSRPVTSQVAYRLRRVSTGVERAVDYDHQLFESLLLVVPQPEAMRMIALHFCLP